MLYQQNVREALTERGWSITQNEAGKLTAERLRIPGPGDFVLNSDNSYARLKIDFRADGKSHTVSSARASLCIYAQHSSHHDRSWMIYPPLALRDPKLAQEYRDILAEADAHLAAGHHAYGTSGQVRSRDAGTSDKVAIK